MLVVNVIPFLSVLFMVIILTVLDSFHPMDALGACLRLACTYWYLLRVADVALWHPFTAVSVEDILDAENEAVEKYCQDLLTVSSSSHEEPSSRSISAIARRFENLHSECSLTCLCGSSRRKKVAQLSCSSISFSFLALKL